MNSRSLILGAVLGSAMLSGAAVADDNTVTIGMILPMTGPSASTGKQEKAAAEAKERPWAYVLSALTGGGIECGENPIGQNAIVGDF